MKNILAFVAFRREKKDRILYQFLIHLKNKAYVCLEIDDWGLILDKNKIDLEFPCCLQIARFIKPTQE